MNNKSKGELTVKIKIFGLLLASSLVLAACGNEEEEANEDTTETEGGPITDEETTDEDQETSTDYGGTDNDAATEENTEDGNEDSSDESDEETSADPSGSSDSNSNTSEEAESTETEGTSNDNSDSSSSSGTGSETIALEDINLTADDAISLAEGEAEGDLHEISFENEGNGWVYKVDLNNGSEESEVVVDHDTEEIVDVRTEQEDDDDNDDQNDVVDYGSLNEAYDAIDEAIADLGGGEVREWSLSMDDGVAEYDIDLIYENQKYEYTIDAESLEILNSEQDD